LDPLAALPLTVDPFAFVIVNVTLALATGDPITFGRWSGEGASWAPLWSSFFVLGPSAPAGNAHAMIH
jgi:hypothetical protein